jgi:hypothetical protein
VPRQNSTSFRKIFRYALGSVGTARWPFFLRSWRHKNQQTAHPIYIQPEAQNSICASTVLACCVSATRDVLDTDCSPYNRKRAVTPFEIFIYVNPRIKIGSHLGTFFPSRSPMRGYDHGSCLGLSGNAQRFSNVATRSDAASRSAS